ncbi:MAG: hypothetical protein U0414_39095 [Polyangiaceae bacterium]
MRPVCSMLVLTAAVACAACSGANVERAPAPVAADVEPSVAPRIVRRGNEPPSVAVGRGALCSFTLAMTDGGPPAPPDAARTVATVRAKCAAERAAVESSFSFPTDADVDMIRGASFLADLDFDGFLDIALLREFGASWATFEVRRYDAPSQRYLADAFTVEVGALPNLVVDEAARRLLSYDISPSTPRELIYRVDRGHLVAEEMCAIDEVGTFVHTLAGKVVETRPAPSDGARMPCLQRHVALEEVDRPSPFTAP